MIYNILSINTYSEFSWTH